MTIINKSIKMSKIFTSLQDGEFMMNITEGEACGKIRGNVFDITYEENWIEVNITLRDGDFRRYFIPRNEGDSNLDYLKDLGESLLERVNRQAV